MWRTSSTRCYQVCGGGCGERGKGPGAGCPRAEDCHQGSGEHRPPGVTRYVEEGGGRGGCGERGKRPGAGYPRAEDCHQGSGEHRPPGVTRYVEEGGEGRVW